MDTERRNRIILISVIVLLLVLVLSFSIIYVLKKKKENSEGLHVSIVELYSADNDLIRYGDYFFEVEDDVIESVISLDGKEVFSDEIGIRYKKAFATRDGNILIYNNDDDNLNAFVFDGNSFIKLYSISNVKYAKPIVYNGKDKSYIIGFCSNDSDNLYLYSSNVGIVVVNNTSLVADSYDQTEDVYYINTEYLITKNSNGLMGVIDMLGKTMIDYQYKNIVGTKENNYIVVNKNDTYNVVDIKNEKLLKDNYQYISYNKGYYYVMKNNKIALYDKGLNPLSDFVIEHNINELDFREENYLRTKKIGYKYYVWNNNGEIDFTYNDLYIFANKKLEKKESFRVIGTSDYIYTYDNGTLMLYDDGFEEERKIYFDKEIERITKVTKVQNNILAIDYFRSNSKEKETCYVDEKDNLLENKFGHLVRKTDNYMVYLNSDNKYLYIVDFNGKELSSIKGDKIKVYNDYLVIDNNLYRIVIE